ncbi:MAG TPA: glycosyltransferase [Thermoplasmata archaeon]|nr:glycosyltransferase [Thermoplasmata archaeon]
MVELWLLAVVLAGSLAALLFQGVAILLALEMPKLGPPPSTPGPRAYPPVSVVIAARNEELDLPGCLDDLVAQDYPGLEIVVVDGGSTDRTREIAKARAPRVRLVEEPPLPEGWVGKNWACDVGYRATSADWVLFTDADLRYHPTAVRATVEWAEREAADLATLAPRIETVGFWEKVVMPFYAQMVLTYFRTPHVNRAGSRAAMANGQYTLVRRSAYERVGGHAAIRSAVLEDVRLAQRFRAAGLRLRVAWAPDLLSTRMYRDRREMFEGLLKNVHGPRFSGARQAAFFAGLVGFFWLPFAVLPLGLLWGLPALALWGAILDLALFAKHAAFARGLRASAQYGLAFPIAVGFYLVLVAASLARGLRGRPLEWKGRAYPIER